jgi:hypothetical protein
LGALQSAVAGDISKGRRNETMKKTNNDLKQRVTAWLHPEMIANMELLMKANDMKNHTEFVSKAVDFYIGYLGSENGTAFLSQTLLGAIQGTLQNTENRVANNLFRLSVEISMMMHLLATTLDITDEELHRLRGRCVAEVKRTRGKIRLDDAVDFQSSPDDEE